jgi:hypothetical protein
MPDKLYADIVDEPWDTLVLALNIVIQPTGIKHRTDDLNLHHPIIFDTFVRSYCKKSN